METITTKQRRGAQNASAAHYYGLSPGEYFNLARFANDAEKLGFKNQY
jgi:hypothetical protein